MVKHRWRTSEHQRYLQTTLSYDRALVEQLGAAAAQRESLKGDLEQRKAELDGIRQQLSDAQDAVRQEAEKKRGPRQRSARKGISRRA